MSTPSQKAIEDKCYRLQAELEVLKVIAICFLGEKKVTEMQQNAQVFIEQKLERLREEPLSVD